VEYGQAQLDDLRAELTGKPAFVRSALWRSDTGWQLRYLEVVAGERPPGWRADRWAYRDYLFVAEEATGDAIASSLTTNSDGALVLDDSEVPMPALHQQVSLQRRPSLAQLNDTYPLPWPVCDYQLNAQSAHPGQQGNQAGMLIGDDCPSFSTYQTAFRALRATSQVSVASRLRATWAVYGRCGPMPGSAASASRQHLSMFGSREKRGTELGLK
jgi:hypothetical protein